MKTNDFIGLVIWMALFIPAILIKPERLQIPFVVCSLLFVGCCIGLLSWFVHLLPVLCTCCATTLTAVRSVSQASGAGSMFEQPSTAPNVGWAFMFGVTSILGAWGGGTLGQSDWTRYAKTKYAPVPSQLVASPVTIATTAVVGIIATSAAHDILGEIIWNPIFLLAAILEYYQYSARARAGVFFASVGLVAAQFSV